MANQNSTGKGDKMKSYNRKWLRIIILSSTLLLTIIIAFILAVKNDIIDTDKIFTKYHPLVEQDIAILNSNNSQVEDISADSNDVKQITDTLESRNAVSEESPSHPKEISYSHMIVPDTLNNYGRGLFSDLVLNSEMNIIQLDKIFESNKNAYPLILQLAMIAAHQILTEDTNTSSRETLKAIVHSEIFSGIEILNRQGKSVFDLKVKKESTLRNNNTLNILEIESLQIHHEVDQYELMVPVYHIYGKIGIVIFSVPKTSVAQ